VGCSPTPLGAPLITEVKRKFHNCNYGPDRLTVGPESSLLGRLSVSIVTLYKFCYIFPEQSEANIYRRVCQFTFLKLLNGFQRILVLASYIKIYHGTLILIYINPL
jgi:hypothetical protein